MNSITNTGRKFYSQRSYLHHFTKKIRNLEKLSRLERINDREIFLLSYLYLTNVRLETSKEAKNRLWGLGIAFSFIFFFFFFARNSRDVWTKFSREDSLSNIFADVKVYNASRRLLDRHGRGQNLLHCWINYRNRSYSYRKKLFCLDIFFKKRI